MNVFFIKAAELIIITATGGQETDNVNIRIGLTLSSSGIFVLNLGTLRELTFYYILLLIICL